MITMEQLDTKPVNGVNGINGINGINSTNGVNGVNGVHGQQPLDNCHDSQSLNGYHDVPLSTPSPVPIAICGIGLRLPGGLSSPEELWDFLLAKGDARCRVPASRYNVSAYYTATRKPGTVASEYGYFLDESVDIAKLDTSSFSVSRSELQQTDPQQRLMLEVARECFEDAGVTGWRGKKIGCYVGNFGEDWAEMTAKETQHRGQYRLTGMSDYIISNRISYEMDLQGPCMTIRTACSSGLVALNEACMAISNGNCEGALVGGVNLILGPAMTIAMTEQGVLSPSGSCKSFSADADGYARGEAVTAVYVKPLADAIRDGNPVRAVIRATSHNFDGKTSNISQPSTDAQEALIRRAYEYAGITNFGETAMVECHGTGTVIGDPIETKAVARVFGQEGVFIGSIKPNLGHSEGASGLTSLIKMILALEHRIIPPNIGFTAPNPNIPFDSAKLQVPLDATPWPASKKERGSVSAFGIGGVNAHVILDSAASFGVASSHQNRRGDRAQLLMYSASSPRSLAQLPTTFAEWADKNPEQIGDLAYTLALRREHLAHRCFSIVDKQGTISPASPPTKPPTSGQKPRQVVMVFTGQGAQWPLMGRELLRSNLVFATSIRGLDKCLQTIEGEYAADYSIETEMLKMARKSRVNLASLAQPLCTAVQIALVDALRSVGVVPAAVVGHSSGEIAAAYAAGALTAYEAIVAAHLRGAVASSQKQPGAMAAIGMGWDRTKEHLVPGAILACDNAPNSVTISGDTDAVKLVLKAVQAERPAPLAKLLQVDKAYHSHHMREVGETYLASLLQHGVIGRDQTSVPFFSSVEGGLLPENVLLDARYWRQNLEAPVKFREAVMSILQHDLGKDSLFLEVGPHSALAGPLRQIFTSLASPAQYVSVMARNRDCFESFLGAIGKIWSLHIPIRLDTLFEGGKCLADLPRYPWDHDGPGYWHESRLSKEWRYRKHPHHELLGIKVPESSDIEPMWRNLLYLQDVPWLRDHKVSGDVVFPFAGYIALAGEAARQLSGIEDGFSVRDMTVRTALILADSEATEILTTMRPHRVTNSLNSQWWWEFSVTSYSPSSNTWIKHCTGEVRALPSTSLGSAAETTRALPRKLAPRDWYRRLDKSGLELGPSFQTFENLETSVDSTFEARAQLTLQPSIPESNYHVHPTLIDGALQPIACAAVNGQARKLKLWLPNAIKKLSVIRSPAGSSSMMIHTSAKITSNLSLVGEIRGTLDQDVVLEGSGLRMGLASSPTTAEDSHAAARYTWAPDMDFVEMSSLIKPISERTSRAVVLNKMAKDYIVASAADTASSPLHSEHLQRYSAWMNSVRSRNTANGSLEKSQAPEAEHHDKDLLADRSEASAIVALQQVQAQLNQIVAGEQTIDKLFSHDSLTALSHLVMRQEDQVRFISCLAHSKPTLRILKISDERLPVDPTTTIIENLAIPGGQTLRCSKLTIASKSYVSGLEHEQQLDNIEYASLDISQDLEDQALAEQRYDLIIASNIVRAGDSSGTQKRLRNVRQLLAPHGRLLLQEINPASVWANFVFGSRQDWWFDTTSATEDAVGDDEGAALAKNLKLELSAAGLYDIEAITTDSMSATVVVKPLTDRESAVGMKVTLLCRDKKRGVQEISPAEKAIVHQLQADGYEINRCTLCDEIPPNQDVLSLLDIEGPFFETMDPLEFVLLQKLLVQLSANGAGIFWPTLSCQMGCQNPDYAPVIGFARTMRNEMLLDFATCEVDSWENDVGLLVRVLGKYLLQRNADGYNGGNKEESQDNQLRPDFEHVIHDGQVHVGRYYPFTLRDELMTSETLGRAVLDIETPGRINSLQWQQREPEPLGDDDVELDVYSAGLNFRDILVALNIVEFPVRAFGLEASGVVTRVGSNVKRIAVGDCVVCLKKHTFATKIVVEELACAKIPEALSFDEAGSMIFVFATAIYSLINVGGLRKGQSVLIHSACGGVGLAAVQVALMCEAEIYATVSNEEKTQFLIDNFGIKRSNIFHSRDDSFAEGLMHQTNGKGADLVLNSLSGELLHATWACVAQFGKMVEIGKRDLLGDGKIDMRQFLENRTYSCVDMDMLRDRLDVFGSLVHSTVEYYEQGRIGPIRPIKVFSADKIQEACRYMQQGQHIGRVCLSLRDSSGNPLSDLGIAPRQKEAKFSRTASYLLVGGLGGIGRAVARWMVEQGAGELVFLSRNAGADPEDNAFLEELESAGCLKARLVAGDVTRLEDIRKAVETVTTPLKGVIQMAMVLRDKSFESMSFDDWQAACSPKIQGTWNLHTATLGFSLDFFMMFSSLSGAIGQRHQANYASANTFLDAFAQYRNSLGLAASAIDIGAVQDVGYISRTPQLLDRMKANGFTDITEQQLLDALTLTVTKCQQPTPDQSLAATFSDPNSFVLGLGTATRLGSPTNRAVWKDDRRMSIYHHVGTTTAPGTGIGATAGSDEAMKSFLASARSDPSILKTEEGGKFLAVQIGRKLFSLLLKPAHEEPNTTLPLVDLGLDSLLAIELREWWRVTFGVDISTLEMLGTGSLDALAQRAVERLLESLENKDTQS
ncbi:fatty acid synthase S-acetyltransferase [Nemania sp. FL0916]|nr:fatty acid synthase S-acetyltransferase [Nemania sp. FL0916]